MNYDALNALVPTHSPVAAIAHLRDHGMLDQDDITYRGLIAELTGVESPTQNEREVAYLFRYVVQEMIVAKLDDNSLTGKEIVALALEKARNFIAKNEYVFAVRETRETTPKLDALGKPKQKKGAKKEKAKQVYADKIEGKNLTRKEAIQILMDEVGMTSGGASTYYANLKSGKY